MDVLRLSALGGLLGLDGTSVGQFMASRPLVAGLLAGWVGGAPALGATIGAILELYLLVSFPTGGARFPEGSTATVVAVASAIPFAAEGAPGDAGMAAVPLAVAVGLLWGQLGGASISGLRHLNARIAPQPEDDPARRRRVGLVHLASIGVDGVRGFLITLSGVVVGRAVLAFAVGRWPLTDGASTGLLLAGGAVSAGILLHDLGGLRRRGVWFAAGMTLGILGASLL